MRDKLKQRESLVVANEFWMVTHRLCDIFRHVLPASSDRLASASCRIVHFIIHSDSKLHKRPGQWRIQRALAASAAAGAALRRMKRVPEHRIAVSAAEEVLERLGNALRKDQTQV